MNGHETKDKAVALKTLNGEDKELMSHQEKDPELIRKSTFDQAATSEDNYDSDIDHPVELVDESQKYVLIGSD